MNLSIKVTNLGRLKKGRIELRPLTVLTGENGTGKSFFTKTLYSIFNIINKNLLHNEIVKNVRQCQIIIDIFDESLSPNLDVDAKNISLLRCSLNNISDALDEVRDQDINLYTKYCAILNKQPLKDIEKFNQYAEKLTTKNKIKTVEGIHKALTSSLHILNRNIVKGESVYIELLDNAIRQELQENFQIANISELISFDEGDTRLSAGTFHVHFNKEKKISFDLELDEINEIPNFPRVVFFESPAYWNVRDALNNSKGVENKKDLTGVPKYFYDLDKTLNTKSTNQPLEIISKLAVELKEEIGGEFIFESGRLSFVDNSGKNIDKNLISFGMTNLGMIQALLKNNVISEGSCIFFDEPEINLHPTWQILLTKVLIKLAENGVNVVMATHSLDMIKALEVHTKGKDKKFIAVNHFTKEGGLFEFDSDNITENLIESRNELANAYEDLFLSELYDPENEQ
ncbi:AAA family ATPase [Bathymodiolus thermophilus thioautotrophic gill symbiont]|uniref:Endonuclease GajA/Old nuclease/RecF-like AAA domain-containing protein n=1 Tax=Bathymodiolus thermophilus thioautotrophic gill symbiont TaxID=2360 RepID=A0A1J5UFU0_9GAMM|nr:AAA family ATPase [Bathymodiolus thermophilus thioautotrophic gill symbiont]OIR24781.1 hypothetical protein BGC33_04585 [Bathymodiolus thermophilus thioautotrophic gill symbiont]